MSSSSAVVPDGRAPATAVYRPLRMCHSAARVAASLLRPAGEASGRPPNTAAAAATRSASSSPVGCWCSTSRAVWSRTSSARSSAVASGSPWATRRLVASSSSMVAKPASTRAGSDPVAAARSGNISSAVAACGWAGTVRKVASATNASVPSLPTTRCRRTSTGRVWSTKEFTP